MSSSAFYNTIPIPRDSKSTRILELEPATDLESPLVGTLRLVCLEDIGCPPFSALSYVWGTYSAPVDTIRCGPVDLLITTNCCDALRQFRQSLGAIKIWVDAICINQENEEEMSHQIPLMGDIYTWAQTVYVWLGKGTPSSKKALRDLRTASLLNFIPVDPVRISNTGARWNDRLKLVCKLLPPYRGYAMCFYGGLHLYVCNKYWCGLRFWRDDLTNFERDIDILLKHQWFSRAWTFQELILAGEVIVFCGHSKIRLDTMLRGLDFIDHSFYYMKYGWRFMRIILGDFSPTESLANLNDSRYMLSPKVESFRRVLHLWMNIRRPTFNYSHGHREILASSKSFATHQKSFVDIHNRLVPTTWYGMYFLSVLNISISYILFLIIQDLIIHLHWRLPRFSTWLTLFIIMPLWSLWFTCVYPRNRYRKAVAQKRPNDADNVFLEAVILALRQRKATHPKDRVFALYGILQGLGARLCAADYSKTQADIYCDFARDLLSWHPEMVIMLLDCGDRLVEPRSEMSDSPSWVPDWSKLPEKAPLLPEYFISSRRILDTTPRISPSVRFDDDHRNLYVRGYFVAGRIAFCTDEIRPLDLDIDGPDCWDYTSVIAFEKWLHAIQIWGQFNQSHNIHAPQEQNQQWEHSTLSTTLLWEIERAFELQPILKSSWSEWNEHFREDIAVVYRPKLYGEICKVFIDANGPDGPGECSQMTILSIVTRLSMNMELWNEFTGWIKILSEQKKKLFVTSEGFLGNAHHDTRIGDRVALVTGVPRPLILRPEDLESDACIMEGYKVVSPCWIRPFMDGQEFREESLSEIKLV